MAQPSPSEGWPERRLIDRWKKLEHDLLEQSARRIHEFERRLELEWLALRQLHEEALTKVPGRGRRPWIPVAVLAVLLIALLMPAAYFYNRIADRLEATDQAVREAGELLERERADRAADSRKLAADRQRTSQSTDRMLRVLAAHDVRRFPLYRPGTPLPVGQALWSRSQGLIFEAGGVPGPSAEHVRQIWLVMPRRASAVGILVPDASGRVTATFDAPADLPGNVVAIVVTEEEPASGRALPGNKVLLTTVEQ